MARPNESVTDHGMGHHRSETELASEIDLRAIGRALKQRRRTYLVPTLLAFVLVGVYVFVATPRYTAQTQILLENQETFFTRPDRVNLPQEATSQLDEAAVASQIQLINSPDIARRAIRQLKLAGNDEFDPLAHINPIMRALMLVGIVADPTRESAEARIVDVFLQKLTVYSPTKTRVITIEFTSRDAALAARAANTVAELYIQEQSAAKRAQAQGAAEALSAQIADLRVKLGKADAAREQYRSTSGLLAGTNNMTISGQQLADINSDLSKARSIQADAQAKASMIRDLIRNGKATEVADVTNNDIVRRIWDQRAVAQAQLALESRTLLPGHPRIKELSAQVAQYDLALKSAAKQAATTLENEAMISGQRVANLEKVLSQQKTAVGVSNGDEIHLRALERVAQGYKDQLESSTTKYEEAVARQSSTATPADARIVSRAATPQLPSYPKKVPFIVFGTLATFVFSVGFVVASELLSGRSAVEINEVSQPDVELPPAFPIEPAPQPVVEPTAVVATEPPQPEPTQASMRRNIMRAFASVVDEDGGKVVSPPATPDAKARPRPLASAGAALAATLAFVKHFSRSANQSNVAPASGTPVAATPGIGWDRTSPSAIALDSAPEMPDSAPVPDVLPVSGVVANEDVRGTIGRLVERIVAAHVPGRGLHIVGTSIGHDPASSDRLIALSRELSEKGRSLIVDLGTSPIKLAALSDAETGRSKIMTLAGLAELLAGTAGFAEVIYRDCESRLHFIPTGLRDADFRDFDLILDALSETYDFIVLLTPAYPQSEIAKVMAPYADFVILTAAIEPDRETLHQLEVEMIEAGARDVLIVGPTSRSSSVQSVA